MKCIRCGNETSNRDAVCDDCRNAEEVFRRKVRMESEEHAEEVRMEQERHQAITWKEKVGLDSKRGKLMADILVVSGIALAVSLIFSFLFSFLLGRALGNLLAVTGLEGADYINGFAMLKMAYLNNLSVIIQFTAMGVSGQAAATGSVSILILVLIPFLSFKFSWAIFVKWIRKEEISTRTTAAMIFGIVLLYTFVFALTSFIPVWWSREETMGLQWDARMYFTLASSIIGTFCVVLAANCLAVRRKSKIREEQKETLLYWDIEAFLRIGAVYLALSLAVTLVGILLFLSRYAKDWKSFGTAICLLPNLTAAGAGVITGGGYTAVTQGQKWNAVSAYFPGGIAGMLAAMILVLMSVLAVIVIQYRRLKEKAGKNYYIHVGIVTAMLIFLQAVVWKLGYVGIEVEVPSIIYRLFQTDLPMGVHMGASFWRMTAVMIFLSLIGVVCVNQMEKREELKILFNTLEKFRKAAIAVAAVGIFIIMLILGLFL